MKRVTDRRDTELLVLDPCAKTTNTELLEWKCNRSFCRCTTHRKEEDTLSKARSTTKSATLCL